MKDKYGRSSPSVNSKSYKRANLSLKVKAYILNGKECKDYNIIIIDSKYIHVEDNKQNIPYKDIISLLQNAKGNELIIRLNSGLDYYCKIGGNSKVLTELCHYYFESVGREIPILKDPRISLIGYDKIEMNKKSFTQIDSSGLLGDFNNINIEGGAELIYFRDVEIDLSSFIITRELMRRGGETVCLVTREEVEKTMKIIEINDKLYSFDQKYIANEAKKNVGNPFVIQPELIYKGRKAIYIITDFVQETDLAEVLIMRKRLNERNTRFYAYQIALALKYLHSKGVVYNYLRTENVLLGKDGYIQLDDFGIYRLLMSNKEKLQYIDSLINDHPWIAGYYPPEYFLNKEISFASDWWSLGIVIYELLVGITPFYSPRLINIDQAVCNKKLCFPPKFKYHILISDAARDLLTSLLVKLAEERLGGDALTHLFFTTKEWDETSMCEHKADIKYIIPSKDLIEKSDPIVQLHPDFSSIEPYRAFSVESASRENSLSLSKSNSNPVTY